MRPWFVKSALAVAVIALLTNVAPARALVIAPPPGPARVAVSDAIVVGRVIGLEPQDIQLSPNPGNNDKIAYRVAIVNVTEIVRGLKKEKSVRVAFLPPPMNDPNVPRPIRPGMRGVQLNVGVEGLFFLTKHHTDNVYLAPMYYDVVASENNPNFKNEVNEA